MESNEQSNAAPENCGNCHRCIKEKPEALFPIRMLLCKICGNKRCPKASDHRLACTNSNESGQAGSIYGAAPEQPAVPQSVERYFMKNYRKKNVQPMRPYVPGEDMTGISVNKEDTPELGGMIAVNPKNPEDRWYVAKQFFADNYEEAL